MRTITKEYLSEQKKRIKSSFIYTEYSKAWFFPNAQREFGVWRINAESTGRRSKENSWGSAKMIVEFSVYDTNSYWNLIICDKERTVWMELLPRLWIT